MESIDNGISKSEYSYNSCNQVTSETRTLTGQPARTVAYGYDADHLRLGMVHPSSRIVELAWTQRAQLASVTADGPPPFATYTYDKAGRPKTITHENGVIETKSYNAAGELLSNLHTLGSSTLSGHSYTYDTTSRRTAESFADGTTPARNYGYDLASQVVSATYGGGLADAYAYDPAGNRQTATLASQGGVSLTYTANNVNQYTTITAQPAPVYDANGNLTQQNGNTYTWDSENRLLSVVPNTPATGAQALQYRYDAHHRRVTRTIQEWTGTAWASTATTHFIYDGWNVIEEYSLTSTTSTLAKTYTWGLDLSGSLQGAGGVGALLMAEEVGGSTTTAYHFHYDGNGNVTEITNATGASAATYRYDAFGNTLTAAGSYAATNRYRFSTKPLDAEVVNAPLYYYGYRHYDPLTGRWLSRDPNKEMGGINLYVFNENESLCAYDFLGYEKCSLAELGKREYRTTIHISLYDKEGQLRGLAVEALNAFDLTESLTDSNLSLVTAVTYTGEVEVKVQECKCTNAASRGFGWLNFKDGTYEWVDERVVGRKAVTGSNAWFRETYEPVRWDQFLADAKIIADSIIDSD